MAFTFDPATDRGKVRLLIQDDTEQHNGVDVYFFIDAKIDAFIVMAAGIDGDTVFNAAALALDSWASNEAMVMKAVRLLDISTSGPTVSASLRAYAERLRELARQTSDDAGFDFAEPYLGRFSWVEQVLNEAVRDA